MREYSSFKNFYMGNEFLFQLLLVSLLFLPWFRRRRLFPVKYSILTAVYILVSVLVKIPPPFYYLVIFTLYFVSVIVSFDIVPGEALLLSVNTYCVQFTISTFTYAVALLFFRLGWGIPYFIISPVGMLGIAAPIYFLYTRKMLKRDRIIFNSIIVFSASAVFLTVAVFVSHYMQEMLSVDQLGLAILLKLFFSMFGAAVFTVNIFNQHSTDIEQERKVLCLLLQKDKEYYERAKISADRLNIKYHDLKQAINKGAVTEEFLDETGSDLCFATGNRALDIILTEKSLICKKEGIKFICFADGSCLNGLKPYHIYSLFGNALDNSIESLRKIDEPQKREVTVNVGRNNDMCVISIENIYSGTVNIKNGEIQTSKSDSENHGYGIKSIKDVVANYGGVVNIATDGGVFKLTVVMPLH